MTSEVPTGGPAPAPPGVAVHPAGLCESATVGPGTRIWAFAHVLPGARVGADCNICDGVFIEGDAVVGDRVTVKCGVQLWDGVEIGDDVFIGPNATFTNDPFPRSGRQPEQYTRTVVEAGASLGANCTVLPGVRIGPNAMVGAGAVVAKDVPPNAKVVGNPARIIGYVGAEHARAGVGAGPGVGATPAGHPGDLGVGGARLVDLPTFSDLRGDLTVAELDTHVPFPVRRFFLVYDVPSREVRGEHAHLRCHQFVVCVRGSVRVLVDDGERRCEVLLDTPSRGVHIPPRVWGTQYDHSPDAVLAVFASESYDADDYVRTYQDFLDVVRPSHHLS